MSLYDRSFVPRERATAFPSCLAEQTHLLGDSHHRLLEAAQWGPDIDLLTLMPSIDRPDPGRGETKAWLARILGI
jgi:hypothetical protein